MLNWVSLKLCCGRAYNGTLIPLSRAALNVVCVYSWATSRSGRDGASNGQGPIAFRVSRGLSRRSVLRGLLDAATLAQWFRLPRLRRASRDGFKESGCASSCALAPIG